ncbi:MAG: response regulator [Cyanobacteria bacterium J06639_16]
MTINSDIRDQAYQFFIEEAPELLQEIESGLLSLRQARDTATIHSIMRAAHSLKGGSASVGLDSIKTIAHRLETIFKALYSDTIEINTELETQLLQAYDCLRLPLITQLQQGQFDAQQALEAADPILSQLEVQCSDAIAATADFIPSSEDLGMSMAQSIFEIDVAEGLDRLAAVIANPSNQEVAGELRAQAEVFSGFAELLDLSGFGAIATAAVQALDRYPDQALEIAQLALDDFRAGRTDILSQPASQGGTPSEALLTLAAGAGDQVATTGETDWSLDEATELLGQLGEGIDRERLLAALGLFDQLATSDDVPNVVPLEVTPDIALEVTPEVTPDNITPESDPESDPEGDANLFGQVFSELSAIADLDALAFTDEGANIALDEGADVAANEAAEGTAIAPHEAASVEAASVEDDTSGQTAVPAALPPQTQSKVTSEPVVPGLTVRVEAARLNQMNNLLGELTINRNGLDLQNNQLRGSIKDLLGRFNRFQEIVESLRILSDQMLIAPERRQARLAVNGSVTNSPSREDNFDSLEMDSYTQVHAQTQTLLEEIVQLEEAVEDLSLFSYQSHQSLGRHRKMLSQMQDELMWARMIPLEQVLNRFPRVLRDLSSTYHKAVNLQLSGTDILVDKAVLAKLYDPLVQLLRNSFDHGIEPPELRQQTGKPEIGQIAIQARYEGRQVVIEVRDDGQGLNFARIRDRAVERGWLNAETANTCSEARLSQFIFEPGFSTAQQVSELSGRGVGLDIVRDQLQSLNGSITVTSSPGEGSVFTLTLPLTLTIINLLICFVGATPLAIRSDSIQEILVPKPNQLQAVGSQQFLSWRGKDISVYDLSTLLKYNCFVPEMPPSRVLATVPTPTNWEAPMLVLTRGEQAFALQVDRLVTEQEMVVKPFGTAIKPPIFAYGCTVLGDGNLVPVIDGPVFIDDIIKRCLPTPSHAAESNAELEALAVLAKQNVDDRSDSPDIQMLQATTVLVVDDAVTLRRTLALSLERAGYRVLQARDGQEALEQLTRNQAIQLIVCDVEMPNMNGFEFLTKRRETPQFAEIPTMMLTSRGNDKHRWLAMKLGAVDYFTKPYLEQELLGAIAARISTKR